MSNYLKIIFVTAFFLYCGSCFGQAAEAQDKADEAERISNSPSTDTKNAVVTLDGEDATQDNKGETKKGPVKQVKSARPDMSKSKGARPPDIVRPSGSRIPKGVGRPAGAGRHGR